MKVMYLHGLESGPTGTKAKKLAERFTTHAPDMQMSVWDLRRHNSVARNVVKQKGLLAAGLAGSVAGGLLAGPVWCAGGAVLGCAGFSALNRKHVVKKAVSGSFEACVQVQCAAIREYKPDLIVGSSWGGAVALELIRRQIWSGPCVALCPAYHKIHGMMASESITLPDGAHCLIVHGTDDKTIPIANSRELERANANIRLLELDGENHKLTSAVRSGKFIEIIEDYTREQKL
eukprot:TRINITY_DN9530_c0_g1_i1.p1 TRINITY_DN9530_c0_g1~~TRINITY_DN9530_c0_g1_i1.p1  ORF type:complete len:233 (+),score=33.93 TRINITY_DN9530_c0_g1_i1:277-975(+)